MKSHSLLLKDCRSTDFIQEETSEENGRRKGKWLLGQSSVTGFPTNQATTNAGDTPIS